MKLEVWLKFEEILDEFSIKPIIGVIPDCKDPKLRYRKPMVEFWDWIRHLKRKGWIIAMHGYQHLYVTENSGLIDLNKYSEFAGLPYEVQAEKIRKAYEIFLLNRIKPDFWMAPAHSFDLNTLKALKELTDIEYITDGFAIFPFEKYGFKWLPQQLWKFRRFPFGVWTICLHPNNMSIPQVEIWRKVFEQYSRLFYSDVFDLNYDNSFLKNIINNSFNYIWSKTLKFWRATKQMSKKRK